MDRVGLHSVRDCDMMVTNGTDVLASGKSVWLFRSDGTFVAKLGSLRRMWKAAFLPNHRALIDCYGDGSYHYVSLEDGTVLWSVPKKGRQLRWADVFAISSNGSVVYDFCRDHKNNFIVSKICPEEKRIEQKIIPNALRTDRCWFFDKDGILCVHQTHWIGTNGAIDPDLDNDDTCQFGILAVADQEGYMEPYWKQEWQGPSLSIARSDGIHALLNDLKVYALADGRTFSLLTEEDAARYPKVHISHSSFYPEQMLLVITDSLLQQTLIIDCVSRRVLAAYLYDKDGSGFVGCIIGNEYWMGTSNGIVRQTLPDRKEIDFAHKELIP